MRSGAAAIIIFLFIAYPLRLVSSEIGQMGGKVRGVTYMESGEIMFGVELENGKKFIARANANCRWITDGTKVRLTGFSWGATLDNGGESCRISFEKVVSENQKEAAAPAPTLAVAQVPAKKFDEYPLPVSANGFTCRKDERVVSCTGTFPSDPNTTVQANGVGMVVLIRYSSPYMFSYDSATGCLCKSPYDETTVAGNEECLSSKGNKKSFKWGKNVASTNRLFWCAKN